MPIKSRWGSIPVPDCSIASLVFTSPTHPLSNERPVFIDTENPSRYLTLYTYRLWAQRLAAGLRKHGLQKGDRLLLFSGNDIFFPVVIMGVIMAGGIFTGTNPAYVARELAHQLENSGAKFLLTSPASLAIALEAASHVGLPESQVFVFDGRTEPSAVKLGPRYWSSLLASEDEGTKFEWDACTGPGESDRTVALNYSSGTTGLPKGVEITHRNYVSNCLQQNHFFALWDENRREEEKETDIFLCNLPMFHAYGQTHFAVLAPRRGKTTYVMPKFEFEKMLDVIEKYRVTNITAVPPIVVAMAKYSDIKKGRWDLGSIRAIGSGAAPLSREACQELEKIWEGKKEPGREVNVKQGWGMTEVTCTGTNSDPNVLSLTNTVGELAPNCEAKFMNEDGTAEVPLGERGEFWFRGPNVMKGYWHNEKATKETLTPDGWLKTGDIAYATKDGLIYIVDRKKASLDGDKVQRRVLTVKQELIKVKGNQVAPAELEALLLDHPAVADAAVVGVPNDEDEVPRAYVVLNAGKKATGEEIANFIAQRVTRTKRLTGGVHFIDLIPKNPSGKILRKQLRDKAAKEDTVMAKL